MPSETTTACVRLLVFFRIRHVTFPYGVEDDASPISQTPTTHYTNTCIKLTIVTHLSFSERIAIANLSLLIIVYYNSVPGIIIIESWFVQTCVCVFSSHSFWTSSSLDVPAGGTQDEGHAGFLIHLLSAVRALIFLARRIQPFLSLVDREVEFCVLTIL